MMEAVNKMFWFLICAILFCITIFLHFKSVEHKKLQEEYGTEKGTKLGKIYAMLSSLEFIFWIGLWILPQPTFTIPIFSNLIISITGLSIPILHLIVSLPAITVGAWFGIEGVRETGMELAETHCSPKKILNTGIYSTARHPQYFGWILAHIGISVFLSVEYSLLFTPVLTALIYLISKKEESELIKEFGKEYEDYKKQVPMLLPGRGVLSEE
jgi:protein-S-isoprenylcysteine O-methyltransferase Ste14